MAPRGLKKILKDTVPAKLGKHNNWTCFKDANGRVLHGLTTGLKARVFSDGAEPRHGGGRNGWRGAGGGRARGTAIASQVCRLVNRGKTRPAKGQYTLTKLVLAALAEHKLEPICSERGVCLPSHRLGTAIDLLCYEETTAQLVVVELKTGYHGDKNACAVSNGRACKMRSPISKAPDSTLNRHMAQLAITRELFAREGETLRKLNTIGVSSEVGGALLYVDDTNTQLYPLHQWWTDRSARLLSALRF